MSFFGAFCVFFLKHFVLCLEAPPRARGRRRRRLREARRASAAAAQSETHAEHARHATNAEHADIEAKAYYREVCKKCIPDVDVALYWKEQAQLIELRTDLNILDLVTTKTRRKKLNL